MSDLDLAIGNAAAFWTAFAETRGHEVIRRDGLLVVNGSERLGQRIMVLSPDAGVAELAEVLRPEGAVVVEDAYSKLDLAGLGLRSWQLPVMARQPASLPAAALAVAEVVTADQLEVAESIIVHAFDLPQLQPYRAGELLPKALLDRPGFEVFLVERDGATAGACIVVTDGDVGGIYFVTTLPEHRSRGVARALMHAMLSRFELPMTLTAATAGRPLYNSLGFEVLNLSTWWSRA